MSLTAYEIEQVVAELQPLVGAFVQKVYVPEPRTAIFEVRQPGESHLLLVCAEAGRTRLHIASSRPPSPEPPYAFQGLLRADLTGLAIDSIAALPGERAVRIGLRGKEGTRTLAAELTGRHGNLFLLDEADRVRGSAVPNLSELRDNRPGRPYVPPFARAEVPEGDRASRFAPTQGRFSLSEQMERSYGEHERRERVAERRRVLLQQLRSQRQKLSRTIEKVRGDLERASRAEEHRRRGELLKASLGKLRRGMRELRAIDYTESGPVEVVIALDPARSPKEALEREFHQYRRLLAGQERARARLEQLEGELAEVDRKIAAAQALGEQELLAIAPTPAPAPEAPRRERGTAPALPFREYLSAAGQKIRVGRGARDNDTLTFRLSKGNDAWMHARGVTGAHVVVPLGRDERLEDETLLDAAQLAAQASEAHGGPVEVSWTRVKYVHKTKGTPGAVTYSQEKTIAVRPDPQRLERLLRQRE